MTHKYKINNNKVVGDIIQHTALNALVYTVTTCGSIITIKRCERDPVVIDMPYIYTHGSTPGRIIESINQNCSEIYPTVPLEVTRKELSTIEYLLAESDVPVCVPDVKSLSKKICKINREFK